VPGKIFISYRRDDSAGHAGRVHDRLVMEFGRDVLFMDVDAVPLGSNFVKVLQDEVGKCDMLLAIIGPNWLEAKDQRGLRRIDDPTDFVRVEISAALRRDIPVIPILLEGTRVPRVEELPDELKELSLRNGLNVRHASFHQDIDKLLRSLRGRWNSPESATRILEQAPGGGRTGIGRQELGAAGFQDVDVAWLVIVGAALVVGLAALIFLYFYLSVSPGPV
jgi:hypothetical protein